MICLVYASAATRRLGDDDLLDLLRVSRRNNARTGITGLLLYKDGTFMQALEGEQRTVLDLYGTILRDDRHRTVVSLIRFAITERFFPDWSMGFEQLSADPAQHLPGYNDYLDAAGEPNPAGQTNRAGVFHRACRDNVR